MFQFDHPIRLIFNTKGFFYIYIIAYIYIHMRVNENIKACIYIYICEITKILIITF